VLAGLAATSGGCADGTGFRPLYGSAAVGGANVSEKLAAVDIAPIPGRVGQRLRNEFIYEATGGGAPLPPEYRLEVAIRESVTSTLVKLDGNARGQVYNLDAAFKLIRIADKSVVMEGKSYGRAGFERVTSIFANVRAREDAENRAAKTVGEELRTRLLAYLAQGSRA
jgi:LPS-assembly lipoprotein